MNIGDFLRGNHIDEFEVFGIYDFAENYLKMFDKEKYDEFQETGDYDEMISRYLEIVKDNLEVKYDTILIDV